MSYSKREMNRPDGEIFKEMGRATDSLRRIWNRCELFLYRKSFTNGEEHRPDDFDLSTKNRTENFPVKEPERSLDDFFSRLFAAATLYVATR